MGNNEIYIDGVNVAKCEFFNDYECKLYKQEYWEPTDTTFDFCKEHPLCEYKATAILERLEQERDELKQLNEEASKIIDSKNGTIASLAKVRDELKQENKELKGKYSHVLELAKTNADSNEYCLQELEKENKELKNIIKIHDSTKYDYYKLMKENEEWHIKYAGCNTANSAIQEENKKYRSALEEIRTYLNTLSSIDSDFTSTETYLRITDKIKEVLNV